LQRCQRLEWQLPVVYIRRKEYLSRRRWSNRPRINEMASKGHNASGPSTPSEALAEAIRALVREELNRPTPAPAPTTTPEQRPTWRDGVWLLILVVNVVLFVALIPKEWWHSPELEMPGKILPWIGGGTFILGATWFREHLIAFTRSRALKMTMVCAIGPLVMLQVRFVSLRPRIDPLESHFYVDGTQQQQRFQGQTRIWLRLGGHKFRIQPHDSGTAATERNIEWGWTRLLGAWVANRQPQWALVYPLTITDGDGCKVHIRKSKPKEVLDSDFFDERLKPVADSLEFEPKYTSDMVGLPAGTYEISAEKKGSRTSKPFGQVEIPSSDALDLGDMQCQAK
jgi:hypothetical protein